MLPVLVALFCFACTCLVWHHPLRLRCAVWSLLTQELHGQEWKRDEADRGLFWQLPPPAGIFGVDRETIIDIDESGVMMGTASRSSGHAMIGEQATMRMPTKVGTKDTIILAVWHREWASTACTRQDSQCGPLACEGRIDRHALACSRSC